MIVKIIYYIIKLLKIDLLVIKKKNIYEYKQVTCIKRG